MTTVTAASIAQDMQTTSSSSNKLSQDFDDFLNLLTTQLQNQDPLSPMDSTEFTNQLVSFSQVEQQINMNGKLEDMLSLQLSGMSTVALAYVGMDVNFVGNVSHYNGTDPIEIDYVLSSNATKSNLRIVDADGITVRTVEAGKTSGLHSFEWDGKDDYGQTLPVGNYTVNVDSLDADGAAIKVSTSVPARVTGIASENGIIQLLLEGDRIIPVGSVISAEKATT